MTQITIATFDRDNWQIGGASATLRIYADVQFRTSDDDIIERGDPRGGGNWYKEVACTIAGTTLTVPEFTIDSTTDSSNRNSTYTGVLFDSNGRRRDTLFGAYRIPHNLGSTVQWSAIYDYNAMVRSLLQYAYPNIDQVQTIVDSAIASIELDGSAYLSEYASFAAAVADIGSTPKTLNVGKDVTLTSALVIPSTLKIRLVNTAKFIDGGGGSLTFQGTGLIDAESQDAAFSGFAAGEVVWTGSNYPKRLSSSLWADTNLDAKLTRAIAALDGKVATIIAYPGLLTTETRITEGLSVHFTEGDYTCSHDTYLSTNDSAAFVVESNVRLSGDGNGKSRLIESANNVRYILASGAETNPFDGANENIEITGLTFVGNALTGTDPTSSAINLGNCVNGRIQHNSFLETHGYGAFCGSFTTANNRANGVWITDNYLYGLRTQQLGATSGENIHISRNTIITGPSSGGAMSIIDVEPNADSHGCDNVHIQDNFIDARLSQQSINAITAQKGFGDNLRNVRITGNTIIARDNTVQTFRAVDVDTGANTVFMADHGFKTGQAVVISGTPPTGLGASPSYKFAIWYDQNRLRFAETQADAIAGTAIDLTATGSGEIVSIGSVSNGVQLWGAQYSTVSDNTIIGATQIGVDAQGTFAASIRDNKLIGCVLPVSLSGSTAGHIEGNRADVASAVPLTQGSAVLEADSDVTVSTTAGSPNVIVDSIVDAGAPAAPWWWAGLTITINGVDYVIAYKAGSDTLVLTTNALSNLSEVTATIKTCTNVYAGNNFNTYDIRPTSKILSAGDRSAATSHSPAQVTANQNNYNPGSVAPRWNISTDASREITGIELSGAPSYFTHLDGQRHEIYNAGSFDIVLKHQSGSSTEANRLKSVTGADVTISAGEVAELEYSTVISRWILSKKASSGSMATDTIWDAKGDLAAATAANAAAKLSVGTNGTVLKANSATATGLEWAAESGGGGVLGSLFFDDAELQHVNCGRFWRATGLYSHFFWEAWVKPSDIQGGAGYMISDSQGGAHCLLWGVQPGSAVFCGITGNVQMYAPPFVVTAVDHATNDTLTKVAHGMFTGQAFQIASDTTLPGGLSAATNYYAIRISADTIRVAANFNNAVHPTPTFIDLTSAGSGVITITPTLLTSFSVADQIPYGNDVHLAVAWDGSHLMHWIDGVLVMTQPYAPTYRQNGGGNDSTLHIGGSDHNNYGGNIYKVRGYEGYGRCAEQTDFRPELFFRPQQHTSGDGGLDVPQFCMDFQTKMGIYTDHGKFEGVPHHGVPEALQGTDNGTGAFVGYTLSLPAWEAGEIETGTFTPTAPSTPAGAVIWDSFSRPNQNPVTPDPASVLGEYFLGDVEVGGVEWVRLSTGAPATGAGIINGRAFIVNAAPDYGVDTGIQDVDVRVDRVNAIYQSTGLVVRYKDANDYYLIKANEYEVVVTKVEGGSSSSVAYTPVTGWITLRVVANGTNLEVFTGTATEGTFTSIGSFTCTNVAGAEFAGITRDSIGLKKPHSYDNFLVKAA